MQLASRLHEAATIKKKKFITIASTYGPLRCLRATGHE